MAEILLSSVLGKLAVFTVENILRLCGINEAIARLDSLKKTIKEVEKLKKELIWIKSFIKDADKKCIVTETQKRWVMELIEIAYRIEDAVDNFLLKCPTAALKGASVRKKILRFGKNILKLKFLHEFQEEIIGIRKEISRIDEYRKKYEIKTLGEDIIGPKAQFENNTTLDPIGDPDIVGFGKDKENIEDILCDVTNRRLAVVSIVGPGGLGKTTLAQKLCHSEKVRSKFGKPAWVTISEKYDLLEVLKRIAKSFRVDSSGMDENELANKISEHLKKKKYLIVLDDVWTKELCDKLVLEKVLPNNIYGSRVLITTRDRNVVRDVSTTYEPYEPNFLNNEESLKLLLKNAIPESHQNSEGLSADQKKLANKFIKKCKGLPLALIVLGRLLFRTPFHRWKNLLDTMSWQDHEIDECSKVIATSFEHLPFESKFCFMYFAAFPEDQEIEAQPLLRMWIAEGLIPREKQRTLEETAERFLEDLVQRSIVQVSQRFSDGSIERLRVHDILRDLAIQKAEEYKFLMVCSKQCDWEHCTETRRVAVHYSNFYESMKQYASPNLRSLLVFEESDLDCSEYRLLRVWANMVVEDKPQKFIRMPHLKYLQLDLGYRPDHHFGEWIKTMKSLETLDLRNSYIEDDKDDLDDYPWIWEIDTLRYVSPSDRIDPMQYIPGPPTSSNLPNLQTLKGVRPSSTWETTRLPNIPELRELDIYLDTRNQLEVIVALLVNLKHLVSLSMSGNNIQTEKLEGVSLFLQSLKYMKIENLKGKSILQLKHNMLPPNLIDLRLCGFEFMSDPMPMLEKLGNLKILRIFKSNKSYPLKICCSAGGFKQLEGLTLYRMTMLQEWKIELGAMPLLKVLEVDDCDQLPVPQLKWFIDHKSLRSLDWGTRTKTDLGEANENKISELFKVCPDLRDLRGS